MEIKLTDNELEAFLLLRKMLKNASTPTSQFLHWNADRLTMKYGDCEKIDHIQKLREYASIMFKIQELLGINRGPEKRML